MRLRRVATSKAPRVFEAPRPKWRSARYPVSLLVQATHQQRHVVPATDHSPKVSRKGYLSGDRPRTPTTVVCASPNRAAIPSTCARMLNRHLHLKKVRAQATRAHKFELLRRSGRRFTRRLRRIINCCDHIALEGFPGQRRTRRGAAQSRSARSPSSLVRKHSRCQQLHARDNTRQLTAAHVHTELWRAAALRL